MIQQGIQGNGKAEKKRSSLQIFLQIFIPENDESGSPQTACAITSGYDLDEE